MAIPWVELVYRRRNVRAFIQADVEKVAFVRTALQDVGAGGKRQTKLPPLPPQDIRIIPANRRYGLTLTNSEAGEIEKYPYIALGYYNIDVQKEDTFEVAGHVYKVKNIYPDREERTVMFLEHFGVGNVQTR